MSIFIPFRAYRPTQKNAKAVASRPYDVLNREEALVECEGNPLSFYHVIKPEIDFPESHDHYATEVYQKGKENFDHLVKDGVIVQDKEAQFYVYQLNMNGHEQTGLVGCCAIEDYFNNIIKKHELTRPDKEEDRKNHIRYSRLNYEPVLFSYPHVDAIDKALETVTATAPEYNFTSDDGIKHKFWPITNGELNAKIERLFKTDVPKIYIADGHHRTSAGALVGRELSNGKPGAASYFMAVLFPDNQLAIQDYNRVVKDLNGHSPADFLAAVSEKFEVEKSASQYRPEALHTFGMYLEGQWYKLTAKPSTYDETPIGELDVTILTNQVLAPLLGIGDLRTDKRIDFVGGIRGLGELERRVNSGEMAVAFALYPVSMAQLISIADNDLIMPPKVTWFEPKLRSGLFVYSLED
ncbi:MAG: DUF1015 family protein [Saprospiraceae bacterium]|nr:DUF1015 family protein [Saprospiraceae bacterium]MCF8249864.1 DUF1015 family protein [Saprospiraceae bacterium]MCF8279466.1 DUF1015 family protein [Bacteroidales bacterium]MCF8311702.1 DUF1015 family protein [Saprospiraceae bacterium]MCF8440269.1 DUF1015 family protein [Saprospiraceae bacterium]